MSREIFHQFSELNNSACQNMGCSITGIPVLISEISLFPVLLLATLVHSYIKEEICLLMGGGEEERDFYPLVTSCEKTKCLIRLGSIPGCSVFVSVPETDLLTVAGSAMPESGRDATQRKLTCLCSLNPVPSQR